MLFISVLALAYHLVWCSVQKAIDGGNSERMEKVRGKVREQVHRVIVLFCGLFCVCDVLFCCSVGYSVFVMWCFFF